jgi:hypothetical protein
VVASTPRPTGSAPSILLRFSEQCDERIAVDTVGLLGTLVRSAGRPANGLFWCSSGSGLPALPVGLAVVPPADDHPHIRQTRSLGRGRSAADLFAERPEWKACRNRGRPDRYRDPPAVPTMTSP